MAVKSHIATNGNQCYHMLDAGKCVVCECSYENLSNQALVASREGRTKIVGEGHYS